MGEKRITFARDATGLVREIGWFTALSIVLCNVIGGGINFYAVQATYKYPFANVPLAFALGAIPAITSAVVFTLFGIAMPRSGGGYVYVSRTLSPFLGFLSSWAWWTSVALSFGIIAFLDTSFIGFAFQVVGKYPWDGLFQLGTWMQTTEAGIIVGIIMVIIFFIITVLGLDIFGKVLNALLIIAVIGSIATIIVLATGNPLNATINYALAYTNPMQLGDPANWASTKIWGMISDYTDYLISYVETNGMDALSDTFMAMIFIVWAYIGFTASTFVGGEIKEVRKSMVISVFIGTLLIAGYYVLISGLVYYASGPFLYVYTYAQNSLGGASWALTLNPDIYAAFNAWLTTFPSQVRDQIVSSIPASFLPSFPPLIKASIPLFAALQVPGASGAIALLVAVTGAIWLMNDIPPFIITSARTTFAWAFDRVFPIQFAEVSERWHSPVWATTLVAGVAVLGVFLSASDVFMAAFDTVFLDTIMLWFGAMAAMLFPYVKPEIYERGLKLEWAGVPVITIFGVIAFIATTLVILVGVSGFTMQSIYLQVFIFGLGSLIYVAYYLYNKKIGVDMETIYAEIPPE